jgi:hypothetical protein
MLSVLPSRCEDIFLLLDSRLRGNDETKMIGMSVQSRNI